MRGLAEFRMPSQTAQVMQRIYDENPEWWPYGLRESQLDQTFPVKDPRTKKVAGFVGWQFRPNQQGQKVGYYAVGILPEFRRQGLAKKALTELFEQHQPADVHERRAFIVEGNKASHSLAASLGVPVDPLKVPSLRPRKPEVKLAGKMPKGPNAYSNVSLQQFMPLVQRRPGFTPSEQAAIDEGQSQWFPQVFKSWADSPAVDMAGPGRTAILAGLGVGGLTGLGMHAMKADPKTTAYSTLGAGALGALVGYLHRHARNNDIEEQMRRIPPNGTRRDVLSDPVLQAELNRTSRDGSSDEALRTAQMLAVLQATKRAGLKQAGWGDIARTVAAHLSRNSNRYVPWTAATLGGGLYDGAMHNFNYDHFTPARGLNAIVNAGLFGMAANRNAFAGDGLKRMGLAMSAPVKDVAISGGAAVNNLNSMMPELRTALAQAGREPAQTPAPVNVNVAPSSSSFNDAMKWVGDHPVLSGGMALGTAGLLAGGGMLASDALKSLRTSLRSDAGGRIKVTLPTRKPGDTETSLDLPISQMPLSNALLSRLQRDARRHLNAETEERKRRLRLSPEEIARRTQLLAKYRP